jgi:hypothetical protein
MRSFRVTWTYPVYLTNVVRTIPKAEAVEIIAKLRDEDPYARTFVDIAEEWFADLEDKAEADGCVRTPEWEAHKARALKSIFVAYKKAVAQGTIRP